MTSIFSHMLIYSQFSTIHSSHFGKIHTEGGLFPLSRILNLIHFIIYQATHNFDGLSNDTLFVVIKTKIVMILLSNEVMFVGISKRVVLN